MLPRQEDADGGSVVEIRARRRPEKENELQTMTQALPLDILDLRHFSAADLKPLLDMENRAWRQQLNWNYRTSIELILHYLDSRVLPGFVAMDGKQVTGYSFCVYEEAKAG